MGVAYHANYLIWCEIGRTDFIRQAGMSYADMERDGLGLAVSDATVRYHASAQYNDDSPVLVRSVDLLDDSWIPTRMAAARR